MLNELKELEKDCDKRDESYSLQALHKSLFRVVQTKERSDQRQIAVETLPLNLVSWFSGKLLKLLPLDVIF